MIWPKKSCGVLVIFILFYFIYLFIIIIIFFFAEILGTVDFVLADGTVVFRTCNAEKEKVVFQMVSTKTISKLEINIFVVSRLFYFIYLFFFFISWALKVSLAHALFLVIFCSASFVFCRNCIFLSFVMYMYLLLIL